MLPILSNSDKIWPQKNLKVPIVWRRHTDLQSWWNPFPYTRMNKLLADDTDEDSHFTSLSVCSYRSVTGLKPSGSLSDQCKWGWGLLSIHSMKSYFFTNSTALEPSRGSDGHLHVHRFKNKMMHVTRTDPTQKTFYVSISFSLPI